MRLVLSLFPSPFVIEHKHSVIEISENVAFISTMTDIELDIGIQVIQFPKNRNCELQL